jgi:DNA-binding response OmpR family regulator
LAENEFDLIILDVRLPDVEGFDLCKKIRALPDHKKTPVIFVTGANDLESRARSIISGGNDFICKPFMLLELSVKALAQVINYRRVKEQASSTPNQPSPSGTASGSAVEDGEVVSDVFPNRPSGASK